MRKHLLTGAAQYKPLIDTLGGDRFYAERAENFMRNLWFHSKRDWSFVDRIGLGNDIRMLDYGAGCGLWYTAIPWRSLDVVEVEGFALDFHKTVEEEMVSVGRNMITMSPETLKLVVGNYDLAIFTDVIEHLKNPFVVLERITDKIKVGGLLVFYFAMSLHDAGHLAESIDCAPDCWRFIWDRYELVTKLDRGRYYVLRKRERPVWDR